MSQPTVWDTPEPEPPSDKCPVPGVYRNVDFDEYCSWDAINHSKLQRIDKSPLHCLHAPSFESSAAVRLGQLVHTGQLEPDSLGSRYTVMPQFELDVANTTAKGERSTSTVTAYVKTQRAEWEQAAEAEGRIIVSAAEFAKLQNCLDAVCQCPDAVQCLSTDQVEVSIVWHDRHTGLRCKARIDAVQGNRLVDLKTKEDSSSSPMPIDFEYSLWSYNYYTQAAWYRQGWKELTGDTLPFWFVVVSTTAPSQCIAAPVGQMTLQAGEAKNLERMSLYAECKRSGVWPGYESPAVFELPERYLPDEVQI